MAQVYVLAKKMKVLLDRKIPYSDLFAESLKLDIDFFSDESFDISNVIEDSIVIVRSTYKTHGRGHGC